MLKKIALRFQKFAPLFLRFGLALVFILFGLQKLTNPGQTTSEIQILVNFELADAAALNFYLGLVEILTALAFLLGFRIRLFSLVATVMLSLFLLSFLVKFGISINPNLYRDVGLIGSSLALFLLGAGPWSIDKDDKQV